MIEDENVVTDGGEAPAEPTKDDLMEEARELDIEGRSSMKKDELAAAVETAKADGSEVEYTGSGEAPEDESGPADGVEVVDGEVVPEDVGETVTPPDQPEATEVLSGDVAPDVLDSGDALPRHRREVDGVE